MSTKTQKALWDKILNKTFNDLSKSTEELRDDIAIKLGQIYIFDPNALKQTLIEFYTGTVETYKTFGLTIEEQEVIKNISFPEDKFNKVVRRCEDKALNIENSNIKLVSEKRDKRRLNYIKRIIKGEGKAGALPLPPKATAYLFKNYNQAVKFHKEILQFEIKGFIKNNILRKITNKSIRKKLEKQYNTSILNVGHGASVGASVAALQTATELTKAAYIANTSGSLTKLQVEALETLRDDIILEYSKVGLNTLAIDYTVQQEYFVNTIKNFYIGKTGVLRGSYISVLSLQSTWDNNIDAQTEKRIKKDVLSKLNELKNDVLITKGSDSLLQGIEKVLFYNSSNKLKSHKNIKVKGESNREYRSVNKFNTSHKTSSRVRSGKTEKAQKVTPNFKNAPKPQAPMLVKPEVESPSPLQVVAYINTRLQQEIEKNMIPPALESRTGRFSGSVKVLNMLQTRKGFPSFEYTYDKNPYQVFEMGIGRSPWATVDRDPRKLIDKSIREIAAEMLQGRLYTRRV